MSPATTTPDADPAAPTERAPRRPELRPARAFSYGGQDFRGTSFTGRDLRGESFAGSLLEGASFRGCDLRGVNFTLADLRAADLTDALVDERTDFTFADLRYADLVRCRIETAILVQTNLTAAEFGK